MTIQQSHLCDVCCWGWTLELFYEHFWHLSWPSDRPTDQPVLPSSALGVWQPPACRSSQWSDGPIGLLAQGWEHWDGGQCRVILLLPLLQCLWAPCPWIPPSLQGPDPDSLALLLSFYVLFWTHSSASQRNKLCSPLCKLYSLFPSLSMSSQYRHIGEPEPETL